MFLIQLSLLAALPLALASCLQNSELAPITDLIQGNDDSLFSQPLCPGRHADEKLQSQVFAHFVHTLYVEKNVSKAFTTHVSSNIIEHDPYDKQNRDFIIARLSKIIPFATVNILFSNFGDNIGMLYLKVADNPEPQALADIYRMEGTCIVEHWDIQQARPANATNPLAMF